MTQLGEGIAITVPYLGNKEECNYKPDTQQWVAKLDGSSKTLEQNLGNKPDASCEAELSNTCWPSQAHHLIPHKTLKKHPISKWIKEGDKLYGDVNYSVDHQKNGKWMPYTSRLPEWKISATRQCDITTNRALMFKVMKLSGIQLHQGRHSCSNRYGLGEAGYKERVKLYLKKIKNNTISHYSGNRPCQDCNSKKYAGKYPPRANIVRQIDKASSCIENDINNCKIFVSRIAAEFAATGGFKL